MPPQPSRDIRKPFGWMTAQAVTLRLMTQADRAGMLAFARSLPEHDLLYLRTDITDPKVLNESIDNLKQHRTVTVLAEGTKGEGIIGYGSLHYNEANWTRHLGEIRIQAGTNTRGKGLGRHLARAVFEIARDLGLQKITARMTPTSRAPVRPSSGSASKWRHCLPTS